jgi:hypothetical protein
MVNSEVGDLEKMKEVCEEVEDLMSESEGNEGILAFK